MPIFRKICLACAIVLWSIYSFAQQNNATSIGDSVAGHIKNSLITYYKKYPVEKLFVHTSQPAYSSGETVWYKIYAMAYGKPSAVSRIVYVQLSDTAGNIISHNTLPLVNGTAQGNIDIDAKLKSGWYKLSAFTSWMRNFGREGFYQQQVYIHNASKAGPLPMENEAVENNYHISFYPEGGDLIAGNPVRVAFKAVSEDGLPAVVDGMVVDELNKPVAKVITMHDGMGSFTIEPVVGSAYTAAIKFPDGSSIRVKLPEVKPAGVSMRLWQQPEAVRLTISLLKPGRGAEGFILAAVQNSGQVSTYVLQLYNGFNEVSLQKADFTTGILRLTLFNSSGVPVAERIGFVNKHDLQPPVLRTDMLSFLPHGLNGWSMVVKSNADEPLRGDFSVSVTDGDAFEESAGQNIYSALLLGPELKGDVYNPGYYFKNESDSLAQQLDLVMLTNGWRHFSWQKILGNELSALKYPVEHSMFIAGKIANYTMLPGASQLNVKLLIFNHDSTRFVGYAEPDSNGSFISRDFNHQGLSDIYLQAADRKNHKSRQFKFTLLPAPGDSLEWIRADAFLEPDHTDIGGYFISRAQAESQNRAFADHIMLKAVNVKSTKISPVEKEIAAHVSSKYNSGREFTLDLVNNPTVNMSLIDYIRGRFANLQILGTEADPKFIYRGGNTLGGHTGDTTEMYKPYFYLNEVSVRYESVRDISLQEMSLIRFMPPPVWFAPFNGGNEGAIMIYTKKQSDEIKELGGVSSEYDHFVFNGYSITREYSSPDYVQLKQQGLLDDRITMYWNHDIQTDANGVLKIKFNNTDIAKRYRVIIQGMDAQGRLLYFDKEVEK